MNQVSREKRCGARFADVFFTERVDENGFFAWAIIPADTATWARAKRLAPIPLVADQHADAYPESPASLKFRLEETSFNSVLEF